MSTTAADANYQAIRDSLNHQDWQGTARHHTVVLDEGEPSWNPASTKDGREFYGPATITYTEYQDGAIHAQVDYHRR